MRNKQKFTKLSLLLSMLLIPLCSLAQYTGDVQQEWQNNVLGAKANFLSSILVLAVPVLIIILLVVLFKKD